MEYGCVGVPLAEVKFVDDQDVPPGTFEGYGAVFGNIDSHGDVIEPGAFAASLLERKRQGRALPPMYKMHGMRGGNIHEPVGIWTSMEEDANGLRVKGRLIGLDTEQGKWTKAQVQEGALSGLSIGYRVPVGGSKKGSGKAGEPARFIKQVHLTEVSLVDDPSNAYAQVYMMKSRATEWSDEIKTIRDFEDFLRDVGGFSNAAAKAIASGGFKAQSDPRDEDGTSAELAARIAQLASRIRGA